MLNSIEQQKLFTLYQALKEKSETYLGYPNSQLLNNANLAPFLDLTINNVGDPFLGNNGMNTFEFERELLYFMGDILKLAPENLWGYVTNGGTEGNMFGLYLARENFPNGVLYFSSDSHYSLQKIAKILGLKSCVIESQPNGEIDYSHLNQTIKALRHYPVIINANIGTTMKGAIDNIDKIKIVLEKNQIKQSYIHCDGALLGAMLPLIEGSPKADFSGPIDSVAISGHKFLGSPIPCGIVLARKHSVQNIKQTIEYIGSFDSTISGSRDGFSVLILWQAIKRWGKKGLRDLVLKSYQMTSYAIQELENIGWPAWHNPFSNIIVIRRPQEFLIRKWQLATEGDISHLILMPGITKTMVDNFVSDLNKNQMEESNHEPQYPTNTTTNYL